MQFDERRTRSPLPIPREETCPFLVHRCKKVFLSGYREPPPPPLSVYPSSRAACLNLFTLRKHARVQSVLRRLCEFPFNDMTHRGCGYICGNLHLYGRIPSRQLIQPSSHSVTFRSPCCVFSMCEMNSYYVNLILLRTGDSAIELL